jgi:hypothetical protein
MSSRSLLADIREALDEREKGTAVLSSEEALRHVAER